MIPKIIHYCWFGGNPLPELALKCIDSWKKYFPDYEIKEWNESNYDVNCCDYVREAYEAKKWAFVSDYARFDILYDYGGIYFDTDVEVVKSMEDIVQNGSFMGCEPSIRNGSTVAPGLGLGVNPGLGLGVNPGLGLYKVLLEDYQKSHFIREDGILDQTTVVARTTNILKRMGFNENKQGEIQHIGEIMIYPPEYFCPLDYNTGILHMTENTRTIHHYAATWVTPLQCRIRRIEYAFSGKGVIVWKLGRCLSLPFRIANKFQQGGLGGVWNTIVRHITNGKKVKKMIE